MEKDDIDKDTIRVSHSTGTYSDIKVSPEICDLVKKATDFLDREFVRKTSTNLQRAAGQPTPDQALWAAIRDRTNAISFERYAEFINRVLCHFEGGPGTSSEDKDEGRATCPPFICDGDLPPWKPLTAGSIGSPSVAGRRGELLTRPGIYGVDAYQLLKLATQAFLLFESGVVIEGTRHPENGRFVVPAPGGFRDRECDDTVPVEKARGNPVTFGAIQEELENYLQTTIANVNGRALPYLKRIVSALPSLDSSIVQDSEGSPFCNNILQHRLSCPSLLELIWSYWHEEGMLVQTMNAIALRFQTRSGMHRIHWRI